ncbi:hypothetical protein BZA05DRAFT_465841 [Tricharina praecox]|uniref:uncharacterized protein n=1 Tax=Tricharina praecox TaxID=43433 RepID=UPI00221F7E73|nr:uncharacterized protein BZA05DRAFT_465841 [Tricharina praecox]KAI5855200.1 hypothetical protein BZA05DRAFT_465841 [Tricharina praecox]
MWGLKSITVSRTSINTSSPPHYLPSFYYIHPTKRLFILEPRTIMVAPDIPATHGHLLRDRTTLKAPDRLSPSFVERRRARRAKKSKTQRAKKAAANTTTTTAVPAAAATTTTKAAKGRSKKPPKAIKYWMVLTLDGGRRITQVAESAEVPEDAISVKIVVPASHRFLDWPVVARLKGRGEEEG